MIFLSLLSPLGTETAQSWEVRDSTGRLNPCLRSQRKGDPTSQMAQITEKKGPLNLRGSVGPQLPCAEHTQIAHKGFEKFADIGTTPHTRQVRVNWQLKQSNKQTKSTFFRGYWQDWYFTIWYFQDTIQNYSALKEKITTKKWDNFNNLQGKQWTNTNSHMMSMLKWPKTLKSLLSPHSPR